MMKAILGSALGGVVAGAVALVASAQGRSAPETPWPGAAQANTPYAMTVADTRSFNAAATESPTLVQCEPHQEAVLQRSVVAGREVAQVTCVTRVAPYPGYAAPVGYPAAYSEPRAVATQPEIVQRPVVRTQSAPRRVVYAQRDEARPKRSWAKTAMVIGGSAGAGAGVGGLIGGKKGALVGAAVGGGAASIYEATKRR